MSSSSEVHWDTSDGEDAATSGYSALTVTLSALYYPPPDSSPVARDPRVWVPGTRVRCDRRSMGVVAAISSDGNPHILLVSDPS